MQWIALMSLIATQVGTTLGIYKYFDHRINNIYKRLDDVKCGFVSKEVCKIMHDNSSETITDVEERINKRFDKLEERVQESFEMIIDLLKKQ